MRMILNKELFSGYIKDHHISLRYLARRANISPSVLWRFLNTKSLLTTRNLIKLLKVINLSKNELKPVFVLSKRSNSATGGSDNEIKQSPN